MADIKSREVKLSIDVSEALSGLKAVTREARAATKAVKALEEARKGAVDIMNEQYAIEIINEMTDERFLLLAEDGEGYALFATYEEADDYNHEFMLTLDVMQASEVVKFGDYMPRFFSE